MAKKRPEDKSDSFMNVHEFRSHDKMTYSSATLLPVTEHMPIISHELQIYLCRNMNGNSRTLLWRDLLRLRNRSLAMRDGNTDVRGRDFSS
jgi:hypothetical protein